MAKPNVFKKYQWQFIIGGILLLALVIFFMGKSSGKRGKKKDVKLPNDIIGAGGSPSTDPNINTGGGVLSGALVRKIAVGLHTDMAGFNWAGHDMTSYKEWVSLSNTGFVAVYNDFNQMYISEDKGTLFNWLIDEMYRDSLVDDIILPRMASLNLT